eukprot:12793210-Alexandrium_andersonii.AAC.1
MTDNAAADRERLRAPEPASNRAHARSAAIRRRALRSAVRCRRQATAGSSLVARRPTDDLAAAVASRRAAL